MIEILMEIPRNQQEFDRWEFSHRKSHSAIRDALAKLGKNATDYILNPVSFENFGAFLEQNQRTHNDMDAAIGVQSSDLEDVDPTDLKQWAAWVWAHFLEHQTAERALGISS